MKKRLCSLLLVLLLLPAAAPAEVVGREGMYGDEYIHRIEAPNGQALYYLSKEEEAFVTYRDVNFDGMEDIVVISSQGASNTWFLFFVWDGENYVRAGWDAGDDTGLPNYELLAGDGLVLASCNDGLGGRPSPPLAVPVGGDRPATCAQRGERGVPGDGGGRADRRRCHHDL